MFTVRPHPPQGSLVGTLHFSRWCGGGLRRPFSRAVSSPLGLSLYFCLSTFVYAFPGYLRSRPIGRGALFFCLRFGRPSRVGGSAASYSRFFSAPRRAVALVLLRFPFFPSPRVLLSASRGPFSASSLCSLARLSSRSPFCSSVPLFSLSLLFLLVLLLSLFPLRFCSLLLGTSFLFGPSLFLVALFPYIFLFIFIYFDLSA